MKNFWQKLLVGSYILIILFSVSFSRQVYATGQSGETCCGNGWTWVTAKKNCCKTVNGKEFCGQKDGFVCDSSLVCDGNTGTCATSSLLPVGPVGSIPTTAPYSPCQNDGTGKCQACINNNETWTAIGCLSNDPATLIGKIIGVGGGLAGGIAFLMMLFGAAQLVLSQGVPEKIQAAKEIITSAVIGTVFIFLSLLILKLIGVQILGIPGWS